LSKREADIAVRIKAFGALPPEHLLGQKLAPLNVANYVAAELAETFDPELGGSPTRWISFEEREVHESMIAESSYPTLLAWGAFSSIELMVQATREGLGLCMLPTYVGDRDPSLRRLTKPDIRHVADIWMLCHPDLRDNARFRAARACIAQAIKNEAALFEATDWSNAAPG